MIHCPQMEIDPHTIQQILTKVRDQLRCPQCRKRVDVDMEALKVLGDSFAVMQLRCTMCEAYIMLHATLTADRTGIEHVRLESGRVPAPRSIEGSKNASTRLTPDPKEMESMRESLEKAQGSFNQLFDPQ
jgi:hypothetical protein